jgi:hypothetical protein
MKLEVVSLHGDAPLQAFGYLDGHPWYFRARGDRWWFAVAAARELSFDLAIATTVQRGHGLLLSKKFDDATCRLTEPVARAIIWRAARAAVAFLE